MNISKLIADTRDDELVLKGIQPVNQFAFKVLKGALTLAGLFGVIAGLLLGLRVFAFYQPANRLSEIALTPVFMLVFYGFLATAGLLLVIALLCYVLFLRKPPFDDWVFEVAQKHLGTEVIFYNSKCLFISYDVASTKDVDKRQFTVDMSDKSNHYSYFLEHTFIDQQVLQVRCTKRQPVPNLATFKKEDDELWNFIPIGLALNNVTQKIAPVGWYLNDNNISDEAILTPPSTSILVCGGTGSGKSVLEQAIVGHVSRFSDKFQLVGVDVKRVEFNLLRGVKGVKGVALDVSTSADVLTAFQKAMMDRFKFMEDQQVNNIYKIKNALVNYYTVNGERYQFDELIEVVSDIDKNIRGYDKLLLQYPSGRKPEIITIEELYTRIEKGTISNPQLPVVKGKNSFVKLDDFKVEKDVFVPKAMLFLADELNELMTSEDYKAVDSIKHNLGSIARLGRAAGVHLALAAQRASGGTISSDLKNNIQQSILLGMFDPSASQLMFDRDISDLAKAEPKGRGFMQAGNNIIEVQTYFTKPENDWVFDVSRLDTYKNPEYHKQAYGEVIQDQEKLNSIISAEGFIEQFNVAGEIIEEDTAEEIEEEIIEEDYDFEQPIIKSRGSRKDKKIEETEQLSIKDIFKEEIKQEDNEVVDSSFDESIDSSFDEAVDDDAYAAAGEPEVFEIEYDDVVSSATPKKLKF